MRRPSTELVLAPGSNATPWRAYVDVELETDKGAQRFPRAVLDQHTVVGRLPGLPLSLDHDTVSRKHAEVFCDPFGRWWIRDLGSTNGTMVNGERVNERVLHPGDKVGVGDFRLRFHLGTMTEMKATAPSLEDTLDGTAAPSWMRTLRELEPPHISATQLSLLMALSRRLLTTENPHERLEALCELLVSKEFHGTVSLVVRLEPGQPTRILSGPKRPPEAPEEPPYVSRTVLRNAAEKNEAVLGSNLPQVATGNVAEVELTISAEIVPLATIAVPVRRGDNDVVDILYANLPPHFGRPDWLALFALVGETFSQAEAAWEARRHAQEHAAIERELETARLIQQALVNKSPTYAGLEVAIGFEPCRWVGGDYVDSVTLADGRILCTVADVCGKGLQAALVTFSIHTMIRAMADYDLSVAEILERLNRHLCDYLPEDSFVTMISCAIDPRTGATEYVNAGHLPAFIFDELGNARKLGSAENPALGLTQCSFTTQTDRVSPGEVIFLYTDGLTELRNSAREMLGEDRLRDRFSAVYKKNRSNPIHGSAEALAAALDEFRGDELIEDDRAFLLARRFVAPRPPLTPVGHDGRERSGPKS